MAHAPDIMTLTETPAAASALRDGPGQRAAIVEARELLARTVELPSSSRDLLDVLGEYRRTLSALAAADGADLAPAR